MAIHDGADYMLKKQTASIFSFVKWLTSKYVELERDTLPYPCKLLGIITKDGTQVASIQFSGQSHTIEVPVSTIVDKNFFEFFSPHHKKQLFENVYSKIKLKLTDQFFCCTTNKQMITLTDIASDNKMTIPIEVASTNSNIVNQLNSTDANRIGFAAGIEYLKYLSNFGQKN